MTTPWNNILHTALLGTDKQTIQPGQLGEDLSPIAEQIAAHTQDKEEQFLQMASLVFNYRQAGVTPIQKADAHITSSPEEQKPYCSPQAMQLLNDVLALEEYRLLHVWLTLCREHGQLIRPDLLSTLLDLGSDKKWLRDDLIACGGERARWLAALNPDWEVYNPPIQTDEEIWGTGSDTERTHLLFRLHHTDPGKARELLMSTWPKEDANTKASLLSTYAAGPADLPFIEGLLTDKSKKVRETAFAQLQRIPGSSLLQQYETAIMVRLILKKEKALLGLTSKFVLAVQSPTEELPPMIVQSGIEKLSNKKALSDEENICYQLMCHLPPDLYTQLWDRTKAEVVSLFVDDPLGKKLQEAFITAVVRHPDQEYARLLEKAGVVTHALIPLLPEQDQDRLAARLFQTSPEQAMVYAQTRQNEWGPQLTEAVLKFAAKDHYRYNKGWAGMYIERMPNATLRILPGIQPGPDLTVGAGSWPAISETIQQLVQLKIQIKEAFNK